MGSCLDFEENKALFKMNKSPVPGISCLGPAKSLGETSAYSRHYVVPTEAQRNMASMSISGPLQLGQTVGVRGYVAHVSSTSHDLHQLRRIAPVSESCTNVASLVPQG